MLSFSVWSGSFRDVHHLPQSDTGIRETVVDRVVILMWSQDTVRHQVSSEELQCHMRIQGCLIVIDYFFSASLFLFVSLLLNILM